jgi:pimeloyl-ACP methyl ester carboxylesterase
MQVIYLHGFASSPASSKATFLAAKLTECGAQVRVPDLNEPDFSALTITRMVRLAVDAIDRLREPVVLIGSSLGGFVAVQVALQRPQRVSAVVLLAPAVDLSADRIDDLGDRDVEAWRRTGELLVSHHAYGRTVPLRYDFFADAQRYDSLNATLTMPVLVFQGRRDDAVNPDVVEQWAKARPNVELHMLDDDHQLGASLDYIWTNTRRFLRLRPPV